MDTGTIIGEKRTISWGSRQFFSKNNKHHHISMIDGFVNSQQDFETKIKFAMFGQDHLNKSKRQVGVQPTDIAFQMSFSHTGCPTSTDASDFGRGNTWHLNDGGIELDDENKRVYGSETITYTNNSPDNLEYLWVQLDQNMRAPNSKTNDVSGGGPDALYTPAKFTKM